MGTINRLQQHWVGNKLSAADYFTVKVRQGCGYGAIDAAFYVLCRVGAFQIWVESAKAEIDGCCGQ